MGASGSLFLLGFWRGRWVRAGPGRRLRLDSFWRAEYVGLNGVCFLLVTTGLERESQHLGLGGARAPQPTFTPKSRHHFRFHRKPYCLGRHARHGYSHACSDQTASHLAVACRHYSVSRGLRFSVSARSVSRAQSGRSGQSRYLVSGALRRALHVTSGTTEVATHCIGLVVFASHAY